MSVSIYLRGNLTNSTIIDGGVSFGRESVAATSKVSGSGSQRASEQTDTMGGDVYEVYDAEGVVLAAVPVEALALIVVNKADEPKHKDWAVTTVGDVAGTVSSPTVVMTSGSGEGSGHGSWSTRVLAGERVQHLHRRAQRRRVTS